MYQLLHEEKFRIQRVLKVRSLRKASLALTILLAQKLLIDQYTTFFDAQSTSCMTLKTNLSINVK